MQQLLACGSALQAAPLSGPLLLQFYAALHMSNVLGSRVKQLQLGAKATVTAARTIGLLLGAGRSCLVQLAHGWPAPQLAVLLKEQVWAMRLLVEKAAIAVSERGQACEWTPPDAVVGWLSAAVAAAEVLAAHPGGAADESSH